MAQDVRTWKEEGTDLLRGVSGGAIIGLPVLYTMEFWYRGTYINGWFVFAFLIFALILDSGLNYASGFGGERDLLTSFTDGVTALGVSALLGTIYLVLNGVIHSGLSFSAIMGMISLVAVPVSVGFSIANTQFKGKTRSGGDQTGGSSKGSQGGEKQREMVDVQDIGISIAGATVLVLSVVPTREVALITTLTSGYYWAGLVVLSLLLTYGMVFLADFSGTKQRRGYRGLLQQPIPETIIAYTFSMLTGLLLLFLLERTVVFSSLSYMVGNAAVIGLPASVGGAAGRLIV